MYVYKNEKPGIFTDEGQRDFLVFRDEANRLLETAGAFRLVELITAIRNTGNGWFYLACVDRMVELGELLELTRGESAAQHRVFVRANK